jgi:phage pi2 protein 07
LTNAGCKDTGRKILTLSSERLFSEGLSLFPEKTIRWEFFNGKCKKFVNEYFS